MLETKFVELIGSSHQGIDDALHQALTSIKNTTINTFEIIETCSFTEETKKIYQVKVKAQLPTT